MAKIELRISSKIQKETGMSEVLIRFFSGSVFNLRAGTGVFISAEHFEYFINKAKTAATGVKVPLKKETVTAADAVKNHYIIFDRGTIAVKNRIKNKDYTHHAEAMDKITALQKVIVDAYNAMPEDRQGKIKSDWLKTVIDKFNHPEKYQTAVADSTLINPEIDVFMKEVGRDNSWAAGTYRKFTQLKEHLDSYKKNLHYSDLTKEEIAGFIYFMQKKRKQKKGVIGMKNSSAAKQLCFLKWFLRWATENGRNTLTDFVAYRPKFKDSERKVIFLDWSELMTVYNFQFGAENVDLNVVRDMFCFCCFTGLRFSDMQNFRRANVINDKISVTTVKTADGIGIDLNDYSRAILNKYINNDFGDGRIFPKTENVIMNRKLKTLGQLCGFNEEIQTTYWKGNKRIDEVKKKWELIGTHCGRRTFICNALSMGISPQIVMKWTGHSDYDSMKPYIAITDKAKAEAMEKFNIKNWRNKDEQI